MGFVLTVSQAFCLPKSTMPLFLPVLAALMLLQTAAVRSECPKQGATDGCIPSCEGVSDGVFTSCTSSGHFFLCIPDVGLQIERQCDAGKYFDENRWLCEKCS